MENKVIFSIVLNLQPVGAFVFWHMLKTFGPGAAVMPKYLVTPG